MPQHSALPELVAEYHNLCDSWDRANNTGPLGSRGVHLPKTAGELMQSATYARQSFYRVSEKAAMRYGIKRKEFRAAIKGTE